MEKDKINFVPQSEYELSEKIFNLVLKNKTISDKYNVIDKTLPKPQANPSKIIASELFEQVLTFFSEKVLPFAELLDKSQKRLTNSLDFDMHSIFASIASGSEKLSERGDKLVKNLPRTTARLVKEIFRYILWPWLKESYFLNRGLLKPRGYPGDYIIVEKMYDGNTQSLGLGYIYDTIFLQTQLCQGLRNRKDQMKQILSNYFNLNKRENLCFINVGCGGSRELREISIPNKGQGINIYLMDFDQEALDFSVNNLQPQVPSANVVPLKVDVRELVSEEIINKLGIAKSDFVYSIGLFDYLPDKIIFKLLKNLLALLNDGGLLIFAHKDHTMYNPRIADWFCDWKYYPRTQQDFVKMFNDLSIPSEKVSFPKEKDGYIFFAEVRKS